MSGGVRQAVIPNTQPKSLPEGWRWVRLGEVCEMNPRRPSDLLRADGDPTTFVPMQAVDEIHGAIARPELRPFREVRRGYTYFAENDVLFAKITPCMQNGKHAIARGLLGGVGFGTTEFHVLRPGPAITPEWIHFFIRQPEVLENAKAYFTGAVGQQRVPESYLAGLDIPLPQVEEQKRIAAILNEQMAAVERARAAAEAQLESAKALPAAYLGGIFSSPEASQWPQSRLSQVSGISTGTTPSRSRSEFFGAGTPWVTPGDFDGSMYLQKAREGITELGISEGRARVFQPGTVLLVCIGATVGKVAIAGTAISANQQINALKCGSKLHSEFLYFHLMHDRSDFKDAAASATLPIINQERLGARAVPLPPMADQLRIAGILTDQMSSTQQVCKAIEEELDTINKLPAALLRRAFSGEV